ncbi:MAG TPA: Gfo/Idh/MocA family oxidoreductase [Acidimicrobiales bacterium]|nr:Gfo/Idh/MocA family oxidoreductase [Acidimicrobiales bacterium]
MPSALPPPLRLGLVGCGYQGNCLAAAAARTRSASIVACADPDLAAAEKVAGLAPDVSTHPSVEALLSEVAVDAVLVATPHHVLCPVSLVAIRHGKHVLIEKPVGLNEPEAALLESEAGDARVTLMAGYSCRFSLGQVLKDLVADGVVGELEAMTGAFGSGPLRGWLSSVDTGGGPLLYLGSHLVDLLLWLAGEDPVQVFGNIHRLGTGADGTAAFGMLFSSGAEAQCLVTQCASTFFYNVHIYGRAGLVMLRGWDWSHFEIEVVSQTGAGYAHPTLIRPRHEADHITTMLVPELDEFVLAVRDGRAPAITVTDGRRVLRVLDAVVASDRRGSLVRIG